MCNLTTYVKKSSLGDVSSNNLLKVLLKGSVSLVEEVMFSKFESNEIIKEIFFS